jgi:hypothetical protein
MSVEQFIVQPSSSLGTIALVALIVTGAFLLLLALTTGKRAKTIRPTFALLMIIAIVVIGLGVWLFFASDTPSTIAVG